jgi:hypothetical protein
MSHLCLWTTVALCMSLLAAGFVFWAARDAIGEWWDDYRFRLQIKREFDRHWRS